MRVRGVRRHVRCEYARFSEAVNALIYFALGGVFALWLSRYHPASTPTVPAWKWLVVIVTWPLTAVVFALLVLHYARERKH